MTGRFVVSACVYGLQRAVGLRGFQLWRKGFHPRPVWGRPGDSPGTQPTVGLRICHARRPPAFPQFSPGSRSLVFAVPPREQAGPAAADGPALGDQLGSAGEDIQAKASVLALQECPQPVPQVVVAGPQEAGVLNGDARHHEPMIGPTSGAAFLAWPCRCHASPPRRGQSRSAVASTSTRTSGSKRYSTPMREAGGMGSRRPISSATASTPAMKSPIFSGLHRVT